VLHCYLGMVMHASGEHEKALERLDFAVAIDGRNALARLKQAAVLASLTRYQVSCVLCVCISVSRLDIDIDIWCVCVCVCVGGVCYVSVSLRLWDS
jgi:hypothetical protein